METLELKKQLIDKIQTMNDDSILEEVYRIINVNTIDTEMAIFSEEQKRILDESLKDIENGNYLTNEEANKEIEEWLKK